jgi:hypothetical protein
LKNGEENVFLNRKNFTGLENPEEKTFLTRETLPGWIFVWWTSRKTKIIFF